MQDLITITHGMEDGYAYVRAIWEPSAPPIDPQWPSLVSASTVPDDSWVEDMICVLRLTTVNPLGGSLEGSAWASNVRWNKE